MNVNAVTPPVVYIPAQAIAPSVPYTEPIGLPMPDQKPKPSANGSSFVRPDVPKPGDQLEKGKTAMVAAMTEKPAILKATQQIAPADEGQAIRAAPAVRPGVFDKYA